MRATRSPASWPQPLSPSLPSLICGVCASAGGIVGEWGEPTSKSGGASTPVCLEYASKGVELNFVHRNWDDPENPLAFLALFPPDG